MWDEVLAFLPGMGLGVAKILAVAGVRYQLSPPQTHPSTQSSNAPLLLSLPVPRLWQQGRREVEHQPQGAGQL